MPGYKGHVAGGLVAYALVMYLLSGLNPSSCTALEWLMFTLAGSLFPDIDIKSKGQKWFYWLIFVCFVMLLVCKRYALLAVLGIGALIPMMVRHRGIFHQLWFVLAVPCAVTLGVAIWAPAYTQIAVLDALFFTAGAVSHLWLDLGVRRMVRSKKHRF